MHSNWKKEHEYYQDNVAKLSLGAIKAARLIRDSNPGPLGSDLQLEGLIQLESNELKVRVESRRGSLSGTQRNINPELRVGSSFRVIPSNFFSGVENVTNFLDNIDNNLTYYEIPTQLACAYLKGHLTGRTLDWFDVLIYKVVEEKAIDYAQLKKALTGRFPVVRNRSELETRSYASYQNHNQRPSEFVYELLKIHKHLKLDMVEEKLLDHISRLDPQLLDYVEVRHPQTTSSLLQLIDKYEERFLNRMTKGPSHEFRNTNHRANNQFTNRNKQENWRDTRVNNRYHDTSKPQSESNRFGGQGVGKPRSDTYTTRLPRPLGDNRRFDSRRRSGQSDHRFNNHGGRQGGSTNGAFRGQNGQNRITPVDLPYVPILLNKTFVTVLWDTGAEKSFISEEVYRRYFSYRPRQKTKDRVVTAQGAPC
ncbi:uncharacterized protein TNCV_1474121 [Trichonephila clavipes]|nr:uncharacterized protein TNCV_1474121 [Trichonephila clavipes]